MHTIDVVAPSSGTCTSCPVLLSSQRLRRDSRACPLPNATKAFAIKSNQSVDVEWLAIVSTLFYAC